MKLLFQLRIIFILRLLLGFFFIISAVLKLYPIEYLELNIAEIGIFKWSIIPFLSRLLIASEILIGIFLIFKVVIKITIWTTIISLIGFSCYLIYLMLFRPEIDDCGCMGLEVSMSPVQSLLKNLTLILLSIFIVLFYNKNKGNLVQSKVKIYFSVFLFLSSIAAPFIMNPIGPYSDQNKTDIKKINLNSSQFSLENNEKKITISEDKKIICFFSTQCKFCKLSARKLHTISEKNTEIPLYFVFYGDSTSVKEVHGFLNEIQFHDIPYLILPPDVFFKIGGNALPAIYAVKSDSVVWKANFLTLEEKGILNFLK